MPERRRELHFGMFVFATGHHRAGWRLPNAPVKGAYDIPFMRRVARRLEQAKFDFLFLGDVLNTGPDMHPAAVARLEPFTWMANLAAFTERLGLVVTASTTYNEPYHIARKVASLDHLSGGRAAWNIVTSGDARSAPNFSRDEHWANAQRYDYAEEFVRIVRRLWDSIEDDAFPRDQVSGKYFDYDKFHPLNHKGENFSVAGPLNVMRSPQGHPVVIQAGLSERAFELGAEIADIFFTSQEDIAEARKFYADMKARAERFGRSADDLIIMPAMSPYIGRTPQEARGKYERLGELLGEPDIETLSNILDVDLRPYPLDGPLPEIPEAKLRRKFARPIVDVALRENLTLRQICYYNSARFSASSTNRFLVGHLLMVGTPRQIADQIEEWFVTRAADGFNVCPPYLPDGLDEFAELVIPELQRRGLFRTDYAGMTFRSHLGLKPPSNQFSQARSRDRQPALEPLEP